MVSAPRTAASSSSGFPWWIIIVAVVVGCLLLLLLIVLAVRYHNSNQGTYVVDEANRVEDLAPQDFDDDMEALPISPKRTSMFAPADMSV